MQYYFLPYSLNGKSNSFKAKIKHKGTLKLDDLIDLIATPGSGIGRPETMGVLHQLFEVVADKLSEGYSIQTPLFKAGAVIGGTFEGVNSKVHPETSAIKVRISSGKKISEKLGKVSIERVHAPLSNPHISSIKLGNDSSETTVTSGMLAEVRGINLKFNDPSSAEEGLFMIDEATQTEIKVLQIGKNTRLRVVFVIPQLIVGETYHIVFRRIKGLRKEREQTIYHKSFTCV
jgi:hypothetical protein